MKPRRKWGRNRRAFTLIEIMVVVGIMAVILMMGVPAVNKILHPHGMRKAISDITDACVDTRRLAILHGSVASLVFHPLERSFDGGGKSGHFDDDIIIEMLDINLLEYNESDSARVRFFPDGTSDELTLILRSGTEYKKVSLEVTTGLVSVDNVQ